jgi:hypothetical protein
MKVRELLSNGVEQSPFWEADSSWAIKEIPRIVWNPKVRYRIHNSLPLFPMLKQIKSAHATTL